MGRLVLLAIYVATIILIGILFALINGLARKCHRPPSIGQVTWMCLLCYSVVFWVTARSCTNVRDTRTYTMVWSYGDPDDHDTDIHHIVLVFKKYPLHYVEIYSEQVQEYLESLTTREVDVTFEVVSNFGSVTSYSEVQIGDLKKWRTERDGGGGSISPGARINNIESPW